MRILEELLTPVVSSTPPRDVFGSLELLGRLSEGAEVDAATPATKGAGGRDGKRAAAGRTEPQVDKERDGERLRRALSQMDVIRAALARCALSSLSLLAKVTRPY